jgi:transcription elongation factor S-II
LSQDIIDVLAVLKKEAKITEASLRVSRYLYKCSCAADGRASRQESKIGLAVGKLRSHANREISSLAKEVVKKWKAEVDKEKEARGSSAAPSTPGGAPTVSTAKPPPGAYELYPSNQCC